MYYEQSEKIQQSEKVQSEVSEEILYEMAT